MCITRKMVARENSRAVILSKGGKFLKKVWCYVGEGVKEDNLVISTGLIIGHRKKFPSLLFER